MSFAAATTREAEREARRRASALAWITLAHLASGALLLGLVMCRSQALATAWIDDVVGMVPPIAFLASGAFVRRGTLRSRRASTLAFFAASLVLAGVGGLLAIEGVAKLVSAEHPTIGAVTVLGHVVWRGWPAMAALVWCSVPAFLFERAKLRLATERNDAGGRAVDEMHRVDFSSPLTALVGVAGIGLGWWWADGLAAIAISLAILRDGAKNVRRSIDALQ